MRAFLILSFIAVASAIRVGYNYQPASGVGPIESTGFGGGSGSVVDISSDGSGLNSGFSSGIGGGSIGTAGIGGSSGSVVDISSDGSGFSSGIGGGSIGSTSFDGTSGSVFDVSSDGSGFNSGFTPGIGLDSGIGGGFIGSSGSFGPSDSFGSSGLGGGQIIDGGLNKEYYTYSAPEEDFNDNQSSQRIAASIKKNLRVVFIKAPENNALQNAALQLAKQGSEDKTLIYVLSKQADVSELADQVQQISNSVRHKPEVRFIKYRTPQDAINAQQSIQQQYDTLGGSTHSSNEGVAPVLNYASPAEHRPSFAGSLGNSGLVSSSIGSSTSYLPPVAY